MGEEILYRLRKQQSKIFRYPVAECPSCHELAPYGLVDVTSESVPESHHYCLYCRHITDEIEIQGYVSKHDLEDTGWDEDLEQSPPEMVN